MIDRILKHIVNARQICLKDEIKAMESDPQYSIEFERIGKVLDKAIRLCTIEEDNDDVV